MLNLLPKIPQNILTQNCFYYNILQLLFPFWHVFSAFFAIFPVNAICLPLVWRMCFVLILCRILQELTDTFRTRHNTASALFRADTAKITYLKNRKNVVSTPTERQTKFAKTSDSLHKVDCLATLGEKCNKSKKISHKTACNRTPLPQKRKQNYAQSFGKFFAYCSFPKNSANVTQKFANNT